MKNGWNKKVFEKLEGRVLYGIAVSKDGQYHLRLSLDCGEDKFVSTEGDCCSESWWADVIGAASAYGGTISTINELDLPQDGQERTRQEHDSVYGYQILTDKGSITLAFRNSSNGYYGGSAFDVAKERDLYGVSHNVFIKTQESPWENIITNDWKA